MASLPDHIYNGDSLPDLPLSTTYEMDAPELVLKRALASFAQGNYSEGMALLALIRNQPARILPDSAAFDSLTEHYRLYRQAQDSLLSASRTFASAESNLRISLTRFAALSHQIVPVQQTIPQSTTHDATVNTNGTAVARQSDPLSEMTRATAAPFQSGTMAQSETVSGRNELLPALTVTCFGRFEVWRQQQPVSLCQNRNGQAIFRYLIAQPDYRATSDMLMDAFWSDEEAETARRRLQVAISALRRSLNAGYACDPGGGYILCKNHLYFLSPSVHLMTDVDAFVQHYEAGRRLRGTKMAHHYELACQLYSGPFLPEDTCAHWSQRLRDQLSQIYRKMCAALAEHTFQLGLYENAICWSQTLLAEDSCDEAAHRWLMLSYERLGCRNEALRHYQRCEQILREELGVAPMPETLQVYQDILSS